MSAVSIYLNFQGQCAAAFHFYQSVFGTEFSAPPLADERPTTQP